MHIVVYLAEVAAARVMPDLEANGQAAVVFGRPIDERACQVKGEFVGARARRRKSAQWSWRSGRGFCDNLELIGIPRAGLATLDDVAGGRRSACRQRRSSTRRRARARARRSMSVTLESLATCFQGLLPAQLFTCSRDGIPNAAYLSHVDYVDSTHVALSFQFFNKSRRNIAENPHALVIVLDPDTGQGWQLRLRYVRSETSGPLFDRMALRIEAIASYCGLKGIFKLRAADIYEVLSIEPAPKRLGMDAELSVDRNVRAASRQPGVHDEGAAGHRRRACTAPTRSKTLVDSILAGLEESFGFKHSMILVPAEERACS